MTTSLSNKVVLITGATSGIGRAAAKLFAARGAAVVLGGRRRTMGNELVAEIRAAGGRAVFCETDVTRHGKARKDAIVRRSTEGVESWTGQIDGKGPDGKHVHLEGSASDILRRGADGLWRYIIDNSRGTAVRHK